MAETTADVRRMAGQGIAVIERPVLGCVNVRGDARDAAFRRAIAGVVGADPPQTANTSNTGLLASLLWLGPTEWLVVSDTQSGAELSARLRQSLGGTRGAVTDVTEARIVLRLSGVQSHAVLARGCSIDLDPREFAVGRCAQTLLAKITVLIHASTAEPAFDVYVARSCAGYAWRWFEVATLEYREQTP